MQFGIDGNYGWLGHRKEKRAKQYLYESGYFVDFSQWSKSEVDLTFTIVRQAITFPFDDGFAFWPIVEKVYGKQMPPGPQSVGNCVGYSACLSNFDRICTELLYFGEAESLFVPFVPYSYGAGRVYVGGGQLGGSHGSLGAWQIEADMKYGLLPTDLPSVPIRYEDDMQGSANTNTQWMQSRSILDKWRPQAEDLNVGEGTEISNFDQLKVAVVDKKQPVTIASNWGFASSGLDNKYGIVLHRKSGSWAHQMHIRSVFEIKGQWFIHVGNQWGEDYHPAIANGWPKGGFVIVAELFNQWAPQAEVYVRGSINGRVYTPNFSFF